MGAQFPSIDRIFGIAFQLFRQSHLNHAPLAVTYHFGVSLHDTHLKAAARGA